jgi:hypothetical protein
LSALPSVLSRSESEGISTVVTPVLQIMPELQEVCACPSLPLSGEHMNVDSTTTLSSPE